MFFRFFSLLLLVFVGHHVHSQNFVRFSKVLDSVYESSSVGYIFVECNNTTADTFKAFIVLDNLQTNVVAFKDFFFSNKPILVPPGFQRDTFSYEIFDNDDYDPNKKVAFKLVNFSNLAFKHPDSIAVAYILNDDVFKISFVGAGRTVIESDTTIFIRVACNGALDSATTGKVKLDPGSAVKGKHFLFRDTSFSIAAGSKDTVYIPVKILNDTIVENTREANFTLFDVSPHAALNIRGFTLVIRDDDLKPSSVTDVLISSSVTVYPNPANDIIQIKHAEEISKVEILDVKGALLFHTTTHGDGHTFNVSHLSEGMYWLRCFNHSKVMFARFLIVR